MTKNGNVAVPSIRQYRVGKGLTQQELADRIGINRATLARLETRTSRRPVGRKLAGIVGRVVGKTAGQVLDEYDRLRRTR